MQEGSVWSNMSLVDETLCQKHAKNEHVDSEYLNIEVRCSASFIAGAICR